jgi:hypothetical protein
MIRAWLSFLVILIAVWPFVARAQETSELPQSPLVPDEGWQLVFAHCSACHSLRLVTSNRGNRANWLRLIRWMQETQNLWQFEPAVETRILDYLARNYAPEDSVRRAQLPANLLPPSP